MRVGRDYAAMSDPDRNPMFRRTWNEPRQIGDIAEEITRTAAMKAITRLLGLVGEATGEDRETSFAAADKIRETAGLSWSDVIGRRAA